jgi:hypothetical protein
MGTLQRVGKTFFATALYLATCATAEPLEGIWKTTFLPILACVCQHGQCPSMSLLVRTSRGARLPHVTTTPSVRGA